MARALALMIDYFALAVGVIALEDGAVHTGYWCD
jgi:hypothetical protein